MSEPHEQEKYWNEEGGARWVEHIDRLESMLEPLNQHIFRFAAPQPGEKVLDIGCGGGATSVAFANAVNPDGNVLGADISAVILEVARSRYQEIGNLSFETADAGVHPFEPESFDLITSRFGVMFFPDPVAAFANIRKAVAADGRVVFACWRHIKENPWMGAPFAAAMSVLPPREKPDPTAPGPFSLADPDRLRSVLTDAGLADIQINSVDEPLNIGSAEAACDFMTRMGPAAEPLREAPPALRDQAVAAMFDVLKASESNDGVVMPSAIWIVEASV